jgi:hypothetical protein
MEKSPNGYPLRLNADGSYNSICPRCFCTVARHKRLGEIAAVESAHVCQEPVLTMPGIAKEQIRKNL